MGFLTKEKKSTAVSFDTARCCACGKRIRSKEDLMIIDGKTYCRKCGNRKNDWKDLEFLSMIEDD
jgi:hypothetical protein